MFDFLVGTIEEGQRKGEVMDSVRAEDVAEHINVIITGIDLLYSINYDKSMDDYIKHHFYLLWNSIKAR